MQAVFTSYLVKGYNKHENKKRIVGFLNRVGFSSCLESLDLFYLCYTRPETVPKSEFSVFEAKVRKFLLSLSREDRLIFYEIGCFFVTYFVLPSDSLVKNVPAPCEGQDGFINHLVGEGKDD